MTGLVLITAGGTGGHVFPAEALATELATRGRTVGFVTDRRGQAFAGTAEGIAVYRISASGVAGKGKWAKLHAGACLALGLAQALRLLLRNRPAAVAGFGGYASLPTVLAAQILRIPTILHEQNAVLGRANRLAAARARVIATSFAKVAMIAPRDANKVALTGMPVRPRVAALCGAPYPELGGEGALRIVVMGGSQGARIFSDVVPAALGALPEELRRRIDVSQQCRPEDRTLVQAAYDQAGIRATLGRFFEDAPERLAQAHLVIARSGASTMAELAALGRPAILVPYPHAIDDHQTANARALDEAGGGWLIEQPSFTAEALTERLTRLFTHPAMLAQAARCARAAGVPDAAVRLADRVETLILESVS